MEATAGSSDKTSPNNQFPNQAPLVAASSPRHIPQGWKPRTVSEAPGFKPGVSVAKEGGAAPLRLPYVAAGLQPG